MPYPRLSCGVLAALLFSGNLVLAPQGVELAPIEIRFALRAPWNLPVEGFVVLRPVESEGDPVRLPVSSLTSPLVTRLSPGSSWEVSTELQGFWSPRKTVTVGLPGQPTQVSLDLWPLGRLSGRVNVQEKVVRPRKVLVKTLAVPAFLKRASSPQGALDCPVDEEGRWSCSLPAGMFDLVISAEGFTPHYRWRVEIPAGKTLSLGTVELQRGASVAGWVAVEGGMIDPSQCMVRLSPLLAGGTDLSSALNLERTAIEGKVGRDGFFQITGLAPGNYVLEVRQPGYPPSRVSSVRVEPRSETFLRDPLLLKQALDLQFGISPALDWLGRPWRVQVVRTEGKVHPRPVVFDGPADRAGLITVPGQSPGRFQVVVLDSLGNRLHAEADVLVDGPATARQFIAVDLVTLQGEIRLGDEPLAATLWFGGRSGRTSIKMESDEKGKFHGVLPRKGLWQIDIQAGKPAIRTRTRREVKANGSGKADLEIALVDTRVFGRVLDERGRPVPKADVVVESQGVTVLETTDAAGTFEARCLPEGPAWLGAESSRRTSGRAVISLVDGRAVGPIELRLRPVKKLSGKVVSSRGPVAGSRVSVSIAVPPEGGGTAITDPEGLFELDVPAIAQRAVAVVSAPGYALRAFDAPLDGGPLSLAVSEEGGELEIALSRNPEELMARNLRLVLLQNGLEIPSFLLGRWVEHQGIPRESGQTLRLPDLAPGEYRVCLVPWQVQPAEGREAGSEGEATCDSGALPAGGTLSLKLRG
jgi:Carboxypeptidase regulatory-like domain